MSVRCRFSAVLLAALLAVSRCGPSGAAGDDVAPDAVADAPADAAPDTPVDAPADVPAGPAPVVLSYHVDAIVPNAAKGTWSDFSYEYPPLPVDLKYTHVLAFSPEAFLTPSLVPVRSFGPLVLYSDDLDVLVFSPMEHPFSSLVGVEDGAIRHGLSGDLEEIPAGFAQRWLFVEGHGLAATLTRWGDALLADRGRARADRYADTGLSRLGYWTDNGAAY